ncbi:uncharacterized protein LOC134719199 [Mytilus trossulus]|uniref:uncharacterized protein LOC134719199 n=1 Tax=Mytilus trossulus TaxID=6551 RepID=UPI003007E501
MDDTILLEDSSGKIYQKEGTGKSESLLKDAIDDVNKEKDTYSNHQAALHPKDFNDEHLETVNDETHLKPLGQNVTDTVNDETHLKPLGQNVTDTENDETHLKPLGQNVTDTENDETHLKPLGQNVTDTENDETHLKPLGQNVTDTENQQDDNVFIYSINDESESVILKENENQKQITGEIYEATDIKTLSNEDVDHKNKKYEKQKMSKNNKADPGDSNVFDPTTDISKLEESPMMQRPPSHLTVAFWAKEDTPTSTRKVKTSALEAISDEQVYPFTRNDSKKKQLNDSGIADITEKDNETGNYQYNINFESTSESIVVENENNYSLETKNDNETEASRDPSFGVSDDDNSYQRYPDDNTDSKYLQTSLQSISNDESEVGKSCMDCIKPVQIKNWKEIRKGDHIILLRSFYDHHAIVVKVNEPEDDNCLQISLELIHQTNRGAIRDSFRGRERIVKLKRKTETVDLKKVRICKYWGRIKPKSPDEVVKRATESLNGDQHEFRYNVIDNNCEHFASWCVTGRRLSIQIRKATVVFKILVQNRLRGLSNEILRNKVEYDHGMLCETCFERNKKMLSVTTKKVKEKDDIHKGDIVLYRYYTLLHCSVVLDVIKRKEKYIKCEIAHYAFKGPLTQKKIQSSILKVPYNGSVSVFEYSSGEFETYEPDEVVCRARKRMGEKMFSYFSNDSSHFARWCKLKLLNQKQ